MTYALSWSGGKDSTLALARARAAGLDVRCLFNIYEGATGRVRFHGVRAELIRRQAGALGIELLQRHTHPEPFEPVFLATLEDLWTRGVRGVVFGNIHLADVQGWYEERTRARGFDHREPLWGGPPDALVREFLAAGFHAVITAVDLSRGDRAWVGRDLDEDLVREIETHGADACGEFGEYHSFVYDGPLFQHPVRFERGQPAERDGHLFIDLVDAP
ncbi:MAG: ATP-binding protein [Armatimonadetes bacterium]|nr:ATP-binding protein [Armatimonadota bacterium]